MTLVEQEKDLSSSNSFEKIYQNSYSHGLENIYALETIDIKTIRPIQQIKTNVHTKYKKKFNCSTAIIDNQLSFEFGDHYRDWIEPFILREPIEVLGLSKQIEIALLKHDKCLLCDLIHQDLQKFIFLKGIGQGHIDEIQRQLENYIKGSFLERTYSIDFPAWLRTLTVGMDYSQALHCLEFFGLEKVIPSSLLKNRKSGIQGQKKNLLEESLEAFRTSHRKKQIVKDWKSLVNSFVIPWMRARGGCTSREELLERLQHISSTEEGVTAYLSFFSSVYFNEKHPFTDFLFPVEEDVFCCDAYVAEAYALIIKKAVAYFYQPNVSYLLSELVGWMLRDFAKEWVGFKEGLVLSVLRYSSTFRVRKGPSRELEIILA